MASAGATTVQILSPNRSVRAHGGVPMSGWASRFVDGLWAKRRIAFTRAEIESALGKSPAAVYLAFRRLEKQGRVAMPRRGFYLVQDPPQVVPPPEEWIDDLMRFHGTPYYVGLLSAAALHGVAAAPLDLQVVAGATFRPLDLGRIRFHYRRRMQSAVVEERTTPWGSFRVSTPEMTALDVVRYRLPIVEAAAVVSRLAGRLDGERLVAAAAANRSFPDIQRLGYLLDVAGRGELLERYARGARQLGVALVPLDVAAPVVGAERDRRWRVLVNADPRGVS